jgi:toxin ParE1/3/4
MNVVWTAAAIHDRKAIWQYIAAEDRDAANRLDRLFQAAAERLQDNPLLGRAGQVVGTRELFPHENYRLVYEVSAATVFILTLVHTARLWPPDTGAQ